MAEISQTIENVKKFSIHTPKLSSPLLAELEEIIEKAIEKDVLEFDEEIHLTLSGGTDTSLLATLIKKNYPRRKINAYTVCKPDSPDLYFSSIVAEELKLNHIKKIIDEQEAIKYINEFKEIIKVTGLDVERFRGNRLIWIFLYKTISKYPNKIIGLSARTKINIEAKKRLK